MTLAPARPLTLDPELTPLVPHDVSPTEPHHEGARHATAHHHDGSSRIRVTSEQPRAQRPAYKQSGRPNPAAHLTPAQIEAIGRELDAIQREVMDSRGAKDAAYIRRIIKTQRFLELGSRAVLLFSGVKVKGIRPAWWLGTAGLGLAKILENMEIGHNVLHGQWDWMRDPKIHSTRWEWDFVSPAKEWQHSHNQVHHTYTNVLGRDNDLGYGILRVDPDQRWSLFFLFQPIWHVGNALMFEYSIAAYDLELGGYLAERKQMSEADKAAFKARAADTVAKIKSQARKDYLVHPLMSLPFGGPSNALHTLTANLVANLMRNVWANTVIICGHFPQGIDTFDDLDIDTETRGEWYLRQMLGSGNITGSPLMHIMTGNLSHQIEHHLWPDMPSNRYAEVAPKVRALMERYDLPYTAGPLLKQAASVYKKVLDLSLPNKEPGRRRRDVLKEAVKKAWRTRSLDRFA